MIKSLLTENQRRPVFVFTVGASSRTRAVVTRDRNLYIAGQRHAEPVAVGIDEVVLRADVHISRAVCRPASSQDRAAKLVEPEKINHAEERQIVIKVWFVRDDCRSEPRYQGSTGAAGRACAHAVQSCRCSEAPQRRQNSSALRACSRKKRCLAAAAADGRA